MMMRKVFSVIGLLLLTVVAHAQKFEPNTKWPYVYEHFTPGTIYFEGNEKSSADMNIHLWGNVLHYVKADGKIYQSDDRKVVRVEIGTDAYLYSDHKLMKLIANEGTNLLVLLTKGDFDAMRSNRGRAFSRLPHITRTLRLSTSQQRFFTNGFTGISSNTTSRTRELVPPGIPVPPSSRCAGR